MASRNQNKPSIPLRSPSSKKENLDEIQLDKRRRIGPGKMVGQAISSRNHRQAFSVVNSSSTTSSQDVLMSDLNGNGSSECGGIEYTKEYVDALLNEKPKGKKTDYKLQCEQKTQYIKRLRLCIKWFQESEESNLLEQEKLRNLLESADRKCTDLEVQMKNKIDELEALIMEMRGSCASLQEKLTVVESEKMVAIEDYNNEKEAKILWERKHDSLAEEFEKLQQTLKSANHRIESLEATYRNSQEYNTSLQQYNSRLQMDCETYKKNQERLEQEKSVILEERATLRGRYNLLQEELSSFRDSRDEALKQRDVLHTDLSCAKSELQQVKDDRDCQLSQVQNLTAELVKYKEFTGKSSVELDSLTIKSKALEEACSSQREEIRILEHQLEAANEKLKMSDLTTLETRTEYEDQRRCVQDLQMRLADAEFQIVEAEKLRKKLHNTILELKGNIRVFCRVRPMLPDDGASSEASVICYPTSTESLGRGIDLLQSAGQKHQFSFDKVFSHESSQQEVFVEISQLVQSALDGYKVCIFAYGQTGSGKTYTMMGRPEMPDEKGMIPRSLEQIFQSSQSLSSQGWKYKMQASMLEIYNETIRDLLSTSRANNVDGKQHTIKHDANGNAHVSDLTIVDVCSLKEVSSLLRQAAQSRSVGKTQMNEESSRSHFVFTLRIFGHNESTDQQVQGIINLIDLAGSERLSKSGSTGDRLRETQAINKSLSSLSDVIFSLAKKEDHVPFRNSKLTYLLQPCLGGDSKTLMFVNISPDPSSVGESLCSLRFAARVNACEIGVPRRQASMRSIDSRLSYG
ncbi:Kinesin-like protein kin-14c [Thalictrum thalictroides]|uniref:Kinesin-like protein kin-14c n=1 Tax=Thalictrum thalictroides TaxID=46969 RepID=A0A7J6WKP0_THATH|nr:Kinesin-like protein kin-14c [Thalictrum thalictroides]